MAPEEQAEIDAQELPPGREAKLLCCADQALNRLPRESGVSFTGNIPEPSGHSPVPGMTLLEQGDGTRPGVSSNLTHPGILISAELHSGKSSRGDLRALGCSKEHPAPPASGSDGACDIPKLLQEEMFPENPRQELIDFQHTQNYI